MMSFETYTKSITISSVRFYNKRRDSEREEERPETKTLNERYTNVEDMRRNERFFFIFMAIAGDFAYFVR